MKKNLIGWMIVAAGILLAACEREETDSLVETTDGFRFSIPLTLTSQLQAGDPEYVPITTKVDATRETLLSSAYKTLVLKKIDQQWYLEEILTSYLYPSSKGGNIWIRKNDVFTNLQLTLRPGYYRLVVVLNSGSVAWNPDLKPGMVVKDEQDTSRPVPWAFTYQIAPKWDYNAGYPALYREIFTGAEEFEVSKTGDLHSNAVNGDGTIEMTRKVSRIRFCLKDQASAPHNFRNTQHYMTMKLKTTVEGVHFCDGRDCWGNAYYDPDKPRTEQPFYISAQYPLYEVTQEGGYKGQKYMVSAEGATVLAHFILTDEKMTDGVPFSIDSFYISTASGNPEAYQYYYWDEITGHKLYPNSIAGVVFESTDIINKETRDVRLQIVEDENVAELFDSSFEWSVSNASAEN